MKTAVAVMLLAVFVAGCGTVPNTSVCSSSLNGTHVVYFEQSDRVPKDVLIEAIKSQTPPKPNAVGAPTAFPPDVIAAIVAEVLKTIPQVSSVYANERMNEAMIGRRIMFRGYESTEQLAEIDKIIKSMQGCLEKWTQPNK